MRKSVSLCAGALLALFASDARAQYPQPLEGRAILSVNGGGQAGSTTITRQGSFPLYEEDARFETSQTASTGGIFDISGVYRVGRNWGLGIGYTSSEGSGNATLSGSIPHPVFFGQPRSVDISVADLRTRERAVHLQAVLFVPFVEKVDFMFAAGPSFYNVSQSFATGFAFSEVPPAFNAVQIDDVHVVEMRRNGTGLHISGDATYAITEAIGAGVLLRYTRAGVDFDLGDGSSVEIRPGGFQVAVGARLRF